jgi:hypothetical protein
MKASFATFPKVQWIADRGKARAYPVAFSTNQGGGLQSRRLLPAAGERVEPRVDTLPQIEPDATKCMKCGRNFRETFRVPPRHCLPRSELDRQEAAREDWKYEPAPCDRKGETVHSDPAPDRIASVRNICRWS